MLFLLSFCISHTNLRAQSFDGNQIENLMMYIPASQTFSTTNIAEYVKQNFNSDYKKILAIYKWVTTNIKYDTDSANVINLGGMDADAKISAALRRRRGVCENYAAIFNDICLKTGIKSYMVDGYTKQFGSIDKSGHAWCAVFINNKWYLADPTWDEGRGTTKYFLVEPSEMIKSHMPFDPMWQLLNYPITHREFYNGDFYRSDKKPFFNYADSIEAYAKSDSLQKFKTAALRIERSGLYNNMVKNRLAFAKMHVELICQQKDVDLYNSSIADLKSAAESYNKFVDYRNKKFIPAISDNALQNLLFNIDLNFINAYKKLDEIDRTEAVYKFSTEDVREKLKALAAQAEEQKSFLKLYLNTSLPNRKLLFGSNLTSSAK